MGGQLYQKIAKVSSAVTTLALGGCPIRRGGWPLCPTVIGGVTSSATALVLSFILTPGVARASDEFGRVTLMVGAPKMVGESIRPLQAIFSGRVLETGESDAAGLMVEDVVFHIGPNSRVTVLDEPGVKRLVIEKGYVVLYTDSESKTTVIAETPFGRMTSAPGSASEGGSGWYSVRHDPERANVGPAVSTFAAMEGSTEVVGTAPEAGPYTLKSGQRWRIVQGRIPGPPEEGDGRSDAEELRDTLHRQAAETAHAQISDVTQLATEALVPSLQALPADVITPADQGIFDVNAANQGRLPSDTPTQAPEPPPIEPEVETVVVYAFADPRAIPAGTPETATAPFVSYDGIVANPDWNRFLTAVGSEPAFQPNYLTEFANGGFSYIQLAGPDAQLVDNGGEVFLAAEQGTATGWAIFTPTVAIADTGFSPSSSLTDVVTEGFRAIAFGEHLASGGTIGGDGVDPSTGFARVTDGEVQLNPDAPPGFPQLDLAFDTTGLTVGGAPVADQIAALGAGQNPQQLGQSGSELLFVSSGTTDARGQDGANGFNFNGDPIEPTSLDLPGDRTVVTDNSGAPGVATPLASDGRNTVGIQFAGTGQTVAVIHSTGLRSTSNGTVAQSEHFEIVRGDRASIVQWRADQRVTGADGEPLELEDLNDRPDLRNELFALIGREVNSLTPPDTFTVAGPSVAEPDSFVRRSLHRTPGRLVRGRTVFGRRDRALLKGHSIVAKRALTLRSLRPAGGRLILGASTPSSRRHIGRVSARR